MVTNTEIPPNGCQIGALPPATSLDKSNFCNKWAYFEPWLQHLYKTDNLFCWYAQCFLTSTEIEFNAMFSWLLYAIDNRDKGLINDCESFANSVWQYSFITSIWHKLKRRLIKFSSRVTYMYCVSLTVVAALHE